jgi:hypothetical protein
MVDLAATQLQAKGAAPPTSHEGGQTKATTAKPLTVPLPPSADGVNRQYHQLAEIHTITAAELAECARWCQFSPASNAAYAGAGWRGPTIEPSVARMVTPPVIARATGPVRRTPCSPTSSLEGRTT